MQRFFLAACATVALLSPAGAPCAGDLASSAPAAAAQPTSAAERREVVDSLARALNDRFVFPEIGRRYAAMLRTNLRRGDYDSLSDPTAFASRVTADIQAVSPDGHLRLVAEQRGLGAGDGPAQSGPPPEGLGLEETRMIGKVAYLRFSLFPGDDETAERARRFLLDHADAQAVIIDSRPNHGGGLQEMDAMLPLLYAAPTTLVRMDTRASVGDFLQDKSLVRQPSPATVIRKDHRVTPDTSERRLQHVPVYYLTSNKTASAAEHLALAFKRTHRATLVGETTRGAGHYGGREAFGTRFAAFVPVGRTYDPDTNWDWEGKGVAPDVAVPTDAALDKALALAKAAGASVD